MEKKIYLVHRARNLFFALWIVTAVLTVFLWYHAGEDVGMQVAVGISAGVLIIVFYLFFRMLLYPYMEMRKMYRLYADGYYTERLFDYDIQVDREIERAEKEIMSRFDKGELLTLSKKQAEYLALQNQINPHFLYNTLEGIRSEAILSGMDSVAEMTEALATFFRYTISKMDHLVTLEDELANIENYYVIQQYRFGNKLSLSIEYEDDDEMESLGCMLPKLTLQPIVENSIYHGLEEKLGKGRLSIKIARLSQRILITISDDGVGMSQEKLDELNCKMRTAPLEDVQVQGEKRGGIAIVNVNNRIKLLFGEEYGLYFYSTLGIGTDVEITLPIIREPTEN